MRANIPFLLTFEEWLKIWDASGRLQVRGRNRGQYVMARYGDKGPYAVDNVKIITSDANTKEMWQHHPELGQTIAEVRKKNALQR